MKKGVLLSLTLILILTCSITIISANPLTDFIDWFKDLFNIGEDSDLKGELYNIGDSFWIDCMIADVNNDGIIDLLDQGIVGDNWHSTTCLEGKTCGDLNNDNLVDLIDIGIIGDCWKKEVCVSDCSEK